LPEDDPPMPEGGIDFDLPEDDPYSPRDVSPKEQLWAYVQGSETRINKLQKEVGSLKTQLAEKGVEFDLPQDDPSTLRDASRTQPNEQLWADVRDLRTRTDRLEGKLGSLENRLRGALQQHG